MEQTCGASSELGIVKRIKEMIEKQGIQQSELTKRCQQLGYSVSQSSISKILTGSQRLTVKHLEMFSKLLNVPMEELMVKRSSKRLFFDSKISAYYLSDDPQSDPKTFEGYLGHYQVYFLSSSSTEKGQVKNAKLIIEKEKNYCRAELKLAFGNMGVKSYQGQMLVSREMKTAYILLLNNETGELVVIYIRYRRLQVQGLVERFGLVVSCGAGDSIVPTVGYLLLTKGELSQDCLGDLAGALKIGIGNRFITVPAEKLDLDMKKQVEPYLVKTETALCIDKQKMVREMFEAEKGRQCLEIIGRLVGQAYNGAEHLNVDETLDWEMYYFNQIMRGNENEDEGG